MRRGLVDRRKALGLSGHEGENARYAEWFGPVRDVDEDERVHVGARRFTGRKQRAQAPERSANEDRGTPERGRERTDVGGYTPRE